MLSLAYLVTNTTYTHTQPLIHPRNTLFLTFHILFCFLFFMHRLDNTSTTTGFKPRLLNQRSASIMNPKKASNTPMAINTLSALSRPSLPSRQSSFSSSSRQSSFSLSSRQSSFRPSQSHDVVESSETKLPLSISMTPVDNVDINSALQSDSQSNSQEDSRAKRASLTHLVFDKSRLDIDPSSNEATPNATTREREEDGNPPMRDARVGLSIQNGENPVPSLSIPPLSLPPPSSSSSYLLPIDEKTESSSPGPSQIASQNFSLPSQMETEEMSDSSDDDDDKEDDSNHIGDGENLIHSASPTDPMTEVIGEESGSSSGLELLPPMPIEQRKLNPLNQRRASGSQIHVSSSLLNGGSVTKAGMKAKAISEKTDISAINHQSRPPSRASSISNGVLPVNTIPTSTSIKSILAESRKEQNVNTNNNTNANIDKSSSLSIPTVRPSTTSTTQRPKPRAMSQPMILSPLAPITKDKPIVGSTGVKTTALSSILSSQSSKTSKEMMIANGIGKEKESRSVGKDPRMVNDSQSSTSVVNGRRASTSVVNDTQSSTSVLNGRRASTSVVNDTQSSTSVLNGRRASTSLVDDIQPSTNINTTSVLISHAPNAIQEPSRSHVMLKGLRSGRSLAQVAFLSFI